MAKPQDAMVSLLCKISSLRRQLRHSQGSSAPNYNLFSILDVEEQEVTTHSAFLAHLLDSAETHAQGDLFLRQFFISIRSPTLGDFDDWTVSSELAFAGGRLDLVLRSRKAKAIIVVENKIGTTDHPNQLKAYREWLDRPERKQAFKLRRLLYLTPSGEAAQNATGIQYEAISYRHQIAGWLEKCQPRAANVAGAIEQYRRSIDNLLTPSLMRDHLDQPILDQIKTAEHRAAALRIIRVGTLLKEQLLREFWRGGEAFLRAKLKPPSFSEWSLVTASTGVAGPRYSIRLFCKTLDPMKPHPSLFFHQYNTQTLFRWELGVRFDAWMGRHDEISALPEAKELLAVLDGHSMPRKHGWDGYKLITDDGKGLERTLEEELADEHYSRALFEDGWESFRIVRGPMKELSEAVLRRRLNRAG